MNPFYAQQSFPQWPQQPPFPGAPPMPNGVNVSQQQWQQGQWQFNPTFGHQQPQSAPTQVPWAPAHVWFHNQANAAKQAQSATSASNQFATQQAAASAAAAQQQAQASRNPYKRYPKPPSQEYLSYQLNDNGLGLFDMVPRDEVYKDREPPSGAETPWVWHPKRFPGEEDSGILTAYYKDEHGNRDEQYRGQIQGPERRSIDQPERKVSSTPKPSESNTHQESTRSRSGSGILRRNHTEGDIYTPNKEQERAWEYEAERERVKEKAKRDKDKEKHKKEKVKDKYKSEDSPGSSFTRVSPRKIDPPTRSTSSASAYAEQQQQYQQQQQQQFKVDRSQRAVRFDSPTAMDINASKPPTPSPNKQSSSHSRSKTEPSLPVPHQPQPTQAHEGFSSRAELRPTFSPRIVRTPDHYRSGSSSTPTRPSSVSRSSTTSSRSLDSHHTSSTSVSSQPLQRHATSPATFRLERDKPTNVSGTSTFTEEPASSKLLSPLFPSPSHSRSLSRGPSMPHQPHPLSSIPEGSSVSKSKQSPQRYSHSPAGSGSNTESDSNHSSPYDPPPRSSPNRSSPNRSSPNYPSSHSSSRKRSPLSNPLPTPPRESQIALTMSNSYGQYERPMSSSHSQPAIRIRKGYWSRRGVHLTKDGDLVHPPEDRIYPQELSEYPEDTSVFQDHKGRQKRIDMWRQLPSHNRRIDDYIAYVT